MMQFFRLAILLPCALLVALLIIDVARSRGRWQHSELRSRASSLSETVIDHLVNFLSIDHNPPQQPSEHSTP